MQPGPVAPVAILWPLCHGRLTSELSCQWCHNSFPSRTTTSKLPCLPPPKLLWMIDADPVAPVVILCPLCHSKLTSELSCHQCQSSFPFRRTTSKLPCSPS